MFVCEKNINKLIFTIFIVRTDVTVHNISNISNMTRE